MSFLGIEEASQALEEAVIAVADAARDVASNATRHRDGCWCIEHDDYNTLRQAIVTWSLATEAALAAIARSGELAHGGDA